MNKENLYVYYYIENREQFKAALDQLPKLAKENGWIGVDTEFYRVSTYWPILSLIQVAAGDQIFLFDVLTLEEDILKLSKVFCDHSILKIFHSAEQDLGILNKLFQNDVSPVFDTQISAKLYGFGNQIGYGSLVEAALKITLSKQEQFSQWLVRPLRQEQLFYAALDVLYLGGLYEQMKDVDPKLLEESHRSLQNLILNEINPAALLKKIKRKPSNQHALRVLEKLVVLREEIAQEDDLPRQKVMSDRFILDLVQRVLKPNSDLEKIPGFRPSMKKKWGTQIFKILIEEKNNYIQSLEN